MKSPALFLLLALAGLLGGCASSATTSATDAASTAARVESGGGGGGGGDIASGGTVTAATTATLEGTAWALVRLRGEALVLPPGTRRPFLSFTADGRVYGFGGVNRLSGQPRIAGQSITFGNVVSTRMAGLPAAMTLELRFIETLRVTTGWRIVEDNLELLSEDRVVAIFHAIPDDETE